MPRCKKATYKQATGQWTKMIDGERRWVSCKQLGCPEGKAESLQFANEWVEAWQAEVAIKKSLERQARFTDSNPNLREFLLSELAKQPFNRAMLTEQDSEPQPRKTASVLSWISEWLKDQQVKVSNGGISPSSFALYQTNMKCFRSWWESANRTKIDEDVVRDFFLHVSSLTDGNSSKRSKWLVFRMFVRKLHEWGKLDSPRNLDSRDYQFSRERDGEFVVWTADEFQDTLQDASPLERAVLLLGANCGMQLCDIARVKWDGKATLTYSRHKTERQSVQYTLWPETQEALRQCPDLSGVWRQSWDGKKTTTNKMRFDFPRPFAKLRNTSCAMLQKSPWKGERDSFLGHTPKTITEQYYDDNAITLPAEMFTWLRVQYGF